MQLLQQEDSLVTEKNPKRKILTEPKEVRAFMRNHMQEIYKHQKNLTPEAEHVISFLGTNQDQNVLNALKSKKFLTCKEQH